METSTRTSVPNCMYALGVLIIAFAGMLLGAQQVTAQSCMQEVWQAHGNNQNLTCTANDVTLASVDNICVHVTPGGPQDPDGDGCQNPNDQGQLTCVQGQPFTFTADYTMPLTAQDRYDLGLFIATDGGGDDGAITGECVANVLTEANAVSLFVENDRQYPDDVCGDITDTPLYNPQVFRQTITTLCDGSNGQVSLPWCTTWRQPGADELCDTTVFNPANLADWDAYPGSPSKCNCGLLDIDVFTETASISVVKTAAPPATVPETGGSATYSVAITNHALVSDVTIDTLTDDKYGDITLTHAADGGFQEVTSTTCTMPIVIAAGSTYNCMFTGTVPEGDFEDTYTDIVTACGTDDFGHSDLCDDDDATITYTDVAVDPALSKTATSTQAVQVDVNFMVVVTNHSTHDTLTLNTLIDDVFGDITSVQGNVISTTCGTTAGSLPATLDPSGQYSCMFVGRITSTGLHTDRVSGAAVDEDAVAYGDPPLGDNAQVNISVTFP